MSSLAHGQRYEQLSHPAYEVSDLEVAIGCKYTFEEGQ